jgi:hypothetical protein
MREMLRTTRTGRRLTATKTLGASVVATLIGLAGGLGVAQTAGTPDPTFGTAGMVTTNPTLIGGKPSAPGGGITGTLTAIGQLNGDNAVVTGIDLMEFSNPFGLATAANDDGATSYAAARFNANGQLDRTFGTGGLVRTTPAAVSPLALAPLVQPNGQIVVGGSTIMVSRNASGETVLVPTSSSGSLDTTFGASGIAKTVSALASPAALVQRSNGSHLAVSGGTSAEFSSTGVLTGKSWWGTSLTLSAHRLQAD